MKVKLGISALLAFLVFIFVTQNTDVVQVTFLAWSVEISLVLLVFIMLWAGMIIGWLLNSYLRFSRVRKRQQAANPPGEHPPLHKQGGQAHPVEDVQTVEKEKLNA